MILAHGGAAGGAIELHPSGDEPRSRLALVVRLRHGLHTAVVVGAALAALSLAVTGEAVLTAESGSSPLRAAAEVTRADFRIDAALLASGRQTQPGVWSQRRLPTHPVGLVGLLAAAALLYCLARTGSARFYRLLPPLSLGRGTSRPRGPPLLQLP